MWYEDDNLRGLGRDASYMYMALHVVAEGKWLAIELLEICCAALVLLLPHVMASLYWVISNRID